ncbi:acylphosphatase [Desulfarculus baarsii DSM 2075]|uniref:acylphosphatase n=1 Tax=Desulfarculus baarsii (strain ATCC 33931 / DSM 2075 / LMG 7858 / VKM B-1802 / 2st14) TaxID=644282 RepID=E1QKF3_DESB2|nr:acylphosphatase [Desulfarculus baarsii]ADK86046.1 acylphosphatase [Desulfarculus baarsii DSM 2075]
MEEVRALVLIRGRVQGVAFRHYTKRMADGLGLKGYVRNLPLRRVEALFQGPRPLVEQAIGWCRQGPALARVDDLDLRWQDPADDLEGFEIRQ